MPIRLFAGETRLPTTTTAGGSHFLSHFVSSHSGVVTRFDTNVLGSGNFKGNLYRVEGGVPTDLLWADNTGIAVTGGTVATIAVTGGVAVASGDTYALGGIGDVAGVNGYVSVSPMGVRTYKVEWGYNNPVQDPLPETYTTQSSSINLCYAAYGWIPPTISGISDASLEQGNVGVVLSGSDFMDSGATLWLADSNDFATANKVAQSITAQSDSEITFDVATTGLTSGTHYLFIETELGQVNAVGLEVDLLISRDIYLIVKRADGTITPIGRIIQVVT